jgi:RNA polymerase sigma factor (sigma-70 family)
MDYSKFVTAVLKNDEESLRDSYEVITKVLIKFLLIRLDANIEDAKDSAQNAIMFSIEKIKNEELDHPDYIINYLFTTAKHDYLKHQNKQKESNYEEVPTHYAEEGDQLENILDDEKQFVLKHCISTLKPKQLNYISYWFENPGSDTALVAERFGISINNAWTKKHRIIQVLKECFENNINK